MRSLRFYINILKPYDLLFMLVWVSTPLLTYMRIVLNHIPVIHIFAGAIIPIIFIILAILSADHFKVTIKWSDILLYVVIFSVFILHYAIFPNNEPYIKEYFPDFFIYTLPLYFIGVSMKGITRILPHLEILSYISVISYFIFRSIVSVDGSLQVEGGDMVGAYSMLPFGSYIVWRICERRIGGGLKVLSIFIGLFIFMFLGNRGAMLCYGIFIFSYLAFIKKIYKKTWLLLAFPLVLGGVYVFFNEILLFLTYIADNIGFSKRIFEQINERAIFDSSGRNELIKIASDAMLQHPLAGYGITGDRSLLSIYVHNIFWEIIVHFGLVVGPLILFFCAFVIWRAYKRSSDNDIKTLLLLFIASGLCPLFLSSSYLEWPKFFLLMGFAIYLAFRHKESDRL